MSSFFDEASLVFIPSGYKTSKAYSVKPTSGDGDLAFTRSNDTATRVGPDGLIEKVRTNNIIQSQALATTWSVFEPAGAGTIIRTNNYAAAPDGTMTATRIQNTGASNAQLVFQNLATSPSVISIYAKRTGATNQTFRLFGQNGATQSADLTATDTWQRFVLPLGVGVSLPLGIQSSSTADTYDILFWGAQVESGDIATDYIATTSAAVSVGPVANVPRLDYLNSSCPRLLLEPQRSSLVLFSEQPNNAVWTKRNTTISANSATSPDGYTNADKIEEDTTNDRHDIYQEFSVTSGTAYTISAFVKAAERPFCFLSFGSSNVNASNAFFNLSTGAVVSSPAGVTSTITSYGNGWYRITSTATAGATGLAYVVNGPSTNGTTISYQGVSGSGILVYGYGAEAGAYATSYIPTLGAAVTRGADAAYKSSATALIGQTEGTIFAEFANPAKAANGRYFSISDGTAGNRIDVYAVSPTEIGIYAAKAFTPIVNTSFSVPANAPLKYAIAYKAGSWAWYLNGVQIGTNTNTNVPALSEVLLTTDPAFGPSAEANPAVQALLFKTRLSNSSLAELTSL